MWGIMTFQLAIGLILLELQVLVQGYEFGQVCGEAVRTCSMAQALVWPFWCA